jgi:hypothetical protein
MKFDSTNCQIPYQGFNTGQKERSINSQFWAIKNWAPFGMDIFIVDYFSQTGYGLAVNLASSQSKISLMKMVHFSGLVITILSSNKVVLAYCMVQSYFSYTSNE